MSFSSSQLRRGSPGIGCAVGAAAGAVVGGDDGYTQATEAQAQADRVLDDPVGRPRHREGERDAAVRRSRSPSVSSTATARSSTGIKSDLAAQDDQPRQRPSPGGVHPPEHRPIAAILDDARKRRDSFLTARKGLQGGDTTAVDREIGEFETKIARLQSQLASVNAALTLTELN